MTVECCRVFGVVGLVAFLDKFTFTTGTEVKVDHQVGGVLMHLASYQCDAPPPTLGDMGIRWGFVTAN